MINKRNIKEFFIITVGTLIVSTAVFFFMLPSHVSVGSGTALAMVISYTNWHSVGWAIIHGLMSWVYVIYYVLQY